MARFGAPQTELRPDVLQTSGRCFDNRKPRTRVEMMHIDFIKRWLSQSLVVLTVSAIYLYGYPAATLSYFILDLLYVALGIILTILLFFYPSRLLPPVTPLARLGWTSLTA